MSWRIPLYEAAHKDRVTVARGGTSNAGLRYSKFADAWSHHPEKFLIFNDPDSDRPDWLDAFDQTQVGHTELVQEAAERLWQLIHANGGQVIGLKNSQARFVSGLGLQHPTENGFAWHSTLGVPYLPGSGLKGAVRNFAYESMSDMELKHFETHGGNDDFGKRASVGGFVFTDLLPLRQVTLATEVTTPHFGPYFQDGETPGDWHSPVPIKFLAVEANQLWMCGVMPLTARVDSKVRPLSDMVAMLFDALATTGAGAKTSSGLGYFERDDSEVERVAARIKARMESESAAAKKAAVLANADLQERRLIELSENWLPGSDDRQFLEVSAFLDGLGDEKLSITAARWLKENYLEVGNSGIWKDPDKMKGKKKDKPAFNKRKVEVTKRLKDLLDEPLD